MRMSKRKKLLLLAMMYGLAIELPLWKGFTLVMEQSLLLDQLW